VPKESNNFPLPVNLALLERGEERYQDFLHSLPRLAGRRKRMIAMRGMKRPPSFHQDRLRQVPNGYILRRHDQRFRKMLGLLSADSAGDRWLFIAYVRALQLSRNAKGRSAAELATKLNQGGLPA